MTLKELRVSLGLTQKQLGAQMGVSTTTVSNIEAGKSTLRVSRLRKYIEALGGELVINVRIEGKGMWSIL